MLSVVIASAALTSGSGLKTRNRPHEALELCITGRATASNLTDLLWVVENSVESDDETIEFPVNGMKREKVLQQLDAFLNAGFISQETAQRAKQLWDLVSPLHTFGEPRFSCGDEGEVLLFWDTDEGHAEVELSASGEMYLFTRDHTSGAVQGDEFELGNQLPDWFLKHVRTIAESGSDAYMS